MARVFGIDVSHYQGDVNWEKVAAGKTEFAIVKATEGSTLVDQSFAKNWKGIQEAGLFRGAYHYAHPGGDPETQAAFFASVVGPLGFRDLPVALDLETADHHPADYVTDWTRRFLAKADALFGRKLLVYSGQFWREALKNPQEKFFGEHALWLPAYQAEAQLKIPASWQTWTFWQYSDGTWNHPESVPGVSRCDQNWFNGDLAQLAQLCTGAPPAAEPEAPAASAQRLARNSIRLATHTGHHGTRGRAVASSDDQSGLRARQGRRVWTAIEVGVPGISTRSGPSGRRHRWSRNLDCHVRPRRLSDSR